MNVAKGHLTLRWCNLWSVGPRRNGLPKARRPRGLAAPGAGAAHPAEAVSLPVHGAVPGADRPVHPLHSGAVHKVRKANQDKVETSRARFLLLLSPIEPGIRRRPWQPTPVLLPGKSHGRRSLVGCSPWGRYELDMTERLHFHFSHARIGEGNVNPLQCSCLENPRDGGAWWAAVYGVAQSRT